MFFCLQYDEQFSKEIEEAWGNLCGGRWVNNLHEILAYLIALAGVIGSSEVLVHVSQHFFRCLFSMITKEQKFVHK